MDTLWQAALVASLKPAMWLAVGGVVYFAESPKLFLISLVIAACALLTVRFIVTPSFSVETAGATVLALATWSTAGWAVRSLLRWRARRACRSTNRR